METILMSQRERHRLLVFSWVRRGEITLVKASELLALSYRQAKRCLGRYRREGDKELVHRLRGKPSNRQADTRQKRRKWLAAFLVPIFIVIGLLLLYIRTLPLPKP